MIQERIRLAGFELQGQLAMADRADASAWLEQIQIPTLFVVGEHDQITPPAKVEQMSREVAGSTFVEIPNAGHLPQIEEPEEFNKAVVEFLNRTKQDIRG